MKTLEDRLDQAGNEARRNAGQIMIRPVSTFARRIRYRRGLTGGAAVVVLVGALGGAAVLSLGGAAPEFGSGTAGTASSTTVAQAAVPLDASAVPTVADDTLPRYGLTLDGWEVVVADGGETHTVVSYVSSGSPAILSGEASVDISIWSDTPGDLVGMYRHLLNVLASNDEEDLGEVTVQGGATARAFALVDSGGGATSSEYVFLWKPSDTITAEVNVHDIGGYEGAVALVTSITPITEETWMSILGQSRAAVATAEATGELEPATTIVEAMPDSVPPPLRYTTLTRAWENWVIEAMTSSGFDVDQLDVFEQGMDRGLVHATFTTSDGLAWALAFGPWREGEYPDDPADLPEHFFSSKPGLETDEGLLIVSDRVNPSYVYLAMDIGKIAVSVEPISESALVPDMKMLEDLALAAATTVRQLLAADLVE